MIKEGQVVLLTFPQTDQSIGKLRPALVLRSLPGAYDDWLICMISTELHQQVSEVDEVIHDSDADFSQSGLKVTSLVRVTRVAVVSANLLSGAIGNLTNERLSRIRTRLAQWISGTPASSEQNKTEAEQGI